MNRNNRMCACGRQAIEKSNSGPRCRRCKELETAKAALWKHPEWHGNQDYERKARQAMEPYRVAIPY